MKKLSFKNILAALLAVAFMLGLGYMKSEIKGDRVFYRFDLVAGKEHTQVLDIAKMGFLKYHFQPNVTTLYLRCKTAEAAPNLTCEVTGLNAYVSQGSKKGVWKELKPDDALNKGSWGDFIPVNLEISIPRADVNKHDVASGSLNFYDGEKVYSKVNIKIINSNY